MHAGETHRITSCQPKKTFTSVSPGYGMPDGVKLHEKYQFPAQVSLPL